MGLPLAIEAHKKKDLALAKQHYKRALEQNVRDPILYQNYGALLREEDLLDDAVLVYKEGLLYFPFHEGILLNSINLHSEKEQHLEVYSYAARLIRILLKNKSFNDSIRKKLDSCFCCCISALISLEAFDSALYYCLLSLRTVGLSPQIAFQIFSLLQQLSTVDRYLSFKDALGVIATYLETQAAETFSLAERVNYYLSLAQKQASTSLLEQALINYKKASSHMADALSDDKNILANPDDKLLKSFNLSSWNLSNYFLNNQYFESGWKLYEYGLRTFAPGKQRWQRAIQKPFSDSELNLWRGENLTGKSILLLEEQAVGDMMMFLTLLPSFFQKCRSVGILLNNRLIPIYQRTLSSLETNGCDITLWSFNDVKSKKLLACHYDFQIPIGSICQYVERFKCLNVGSYVPLELIANDKRASNLRSKYLGSGLHNNAERLIGISWRGGGKGKRITQKSLNQDEFFRFLPVIDGIRYVSLQYGEEKTDVSYWQSKGVDVIYDGKINPIANMEDWLNQVAACDAVISVANTTIHGAGGLNIPTMCLLSRFFDWRWLKNPAINRSYWYPSVAIAREDENSNDPWGAAAEKVRSWIAAGCPHPTGEMFEVDRTKAISLR